MKLYSMFNNVLHDKEIVQLLKEIYKEDVEISSPEEADVLLFVRKGKFCGDDDPLIAYIPEKPAVFIVGTAGKQDPEGEALAKKAEELGISEILVCPEGSSSISFDVVVEAVKKTVEEAKLRKITLAWESTGKENIPSDLFQFNETKDLESLDDQEEISEKEAFIEEVLFVPKEENNSSALDVFFSSYDYHVLVIGAKGGVGCSTICAALNAAFTEFGSYHLEVGGRGDGYLYYGETLEEATKESYGHVANSYASGFPQEGKVLLVDLNSDDAPVEKIFELAQDPVVIMVADPSMLSFDGVRMWREQNWPMNILILNKMIYGIGLPPEVYSGELDIENIVSLPGGSDEERALGNAQREHNLPLAISEEYDANIGEIVARIREILKF